LLLGNLGGNFTFKILGLAAESRKVVSGILSSSVVEASRAHDLLLGLSVDATYGVIENLVSYDGVLEVQVLLRNVFSNDSSTRIN
jgi:hypothetical protein